MVACKERRHSGHMGNGLTRTLSEKQSKRERERCDKAVFGCLSPFFDFLERETNNTLFFFFPPNAAHMAGSTWAKLRVVGATRVFYH